MKKTFICALALSAIFCTIPTSAIEEVLEEETTSTPFMLQGNVKEKEIYSYSNYAESIESAGAMWILLQEETLKDKVRQLFQKC